jgi:formylglycine-generating enzyme required for sulfatase activity
VPAHEKRETSLRTNPRAGTAEWTRSVYRPCPYQLAEDSETNEQERVVRGGSWRDRPKNCRAASRLAYQGYQKVYNVGFRVVVETD